MRNILIALAMLFALPVLAFDIPKEDGRVVDNAGILTTLQKESLVRRLKFIEDSRESHPQIAILTVPSLPEEGIEEFANQTFHSWGIGQKGVDNGLLLVVAPNQRKMRLEVGYGLEATIPDSVAAKIIDSMKPDLRAKRWDDALNKAVTSMSSYLPETPVKELTKDDLLPPQLTPLTKTPAPTTGAKIAGVFIVAFLGMIAFIVSIAMFLDRKERKKAEREAEAQRVRTYFDTISRQQKWNNITKPITPRPPPPRSHNSSGPGFGTGFVTGAVTESLLESSRKRRRDDDDDSSPSSSSSSWGSSDSSSNPSSDSGGSWGGGDSGGGGASGDW